MNRNKLLKPNTRTQSLKFGGCTFREGAYIKVTALRKGVNYTHYGVEIIDVITCVLKEVHRDYIVVDNISEDPAKTVPFIITTENIKEVYTIHVPYTSSKFVNWVRKKVANKYNRKMLKHTRKTLYELHKY